MYVENPRGQRFKSHSRVIIHDPELNGEQKEVGRGALIVDRETESRALAPARNGIHSAGFIRDMEF